MGNRRAQAIHPIREMGKQGMGDSNWGIEKEINTNNKITTIMSEKP